MRAVRIYKIHLSKAVQLCKLFSHANVGHDIVIATCGTYVILNSLSYCYHIIIHRSVAK